MPVYSLFAKAALDAMVGGQTLKAVCLSGDYTFDEAHEFRSSVAAEEIGNPATLENVTTTGGVLDADNPTFVSVPAGEDIAGVAIFIETGDPATSRVIVYDDTVDLTPNGGNVVYNVNASGVFRL